MQEEIQFIKEELEACKRSVKHAKIRHYLFWLGILPLIVLTVFAIMTSSSLTIFSIIGIITYAVMVRLNIKYHNVLMLDIEDLECELKELTKK